MADITQIQVGSKAYDIRDDTSLTFAKALGIGESIVIPNDSDLNTPQFTVPGRYYCDANAKVSTLTNCPTAEAFQLLVYSLLSAQTEEMPSGKWSCRTRILLTYKGSIFISFIERTSAGDYNYSAWNQIGQSGGYLPLSGGTMTGMIKLASTGLETSSAAGYITDQHGNLRHARDATGDIFSIKNNAGTNMFSINFESGKITVGVWNGSTIDIAHGGTGLTDSPSVLTNLGSTTAADILAASPRPGITGTLAVAHGGTGATTRLNALKNLTNEDVGTSSQYFLTITSNWGKGGYCSVANAKTVLGLGGIQGRPDYTISTTNLTAGTSALTNGKLYLVYE